MQSQSNASTIEIGIAFYTVMELSDYKKCREYRRCEYVKIDDKHYCLSIAFHYNDWDYETLYDSTGKSHLVKTNMRDGFIDIDKDFYDGVLSREHIKHHRCEWREEIHDNNGYIEFSVLILNDYNILNIDELKDIRLYIPHHKGFEYERIGADIRDASSLYKDFLEYITWEDKKDMFEKIGVGIVNPKYHEILYARRIKQLITDEEKKRLISEWSILDWGWNNAYHLTFDFEKFLLYFFYNKELKDKLFQYRKFNKYEKFPLEDKMFQCETPEEYAAWLFNERTKMVPKLRYSYEY